MSSRICRALVAASAFTLVLATAFAANASELTHTVAGGEYLGAIAEQYGVSVQQLRDWNDLSGDRIVVGQELEVYPSRGGSGGSTGYEIAPGDTAIGIAVAHGVTVEDLQSWNPGLNPDRIIAGRELRIRRTGRATRNVQYEVQSGDFLGRIAERHNVTVAEIQGWNPGMDPDRIIVGDEIRIVLAGPEVPSESVGRANRGELVHGEQLPPHRAYIIRDADRAWGTNETIGAIVDGFDYMVRQNDTLPRVAMHDLSRREGGRISDHRSHQSGRDADIGYYHTGCRRDCTYRRFDPDELDFERQWMLLEYWFDNDLVEYVFMDYAYQETLYEYLREQGESRARLSEWFQYPRGRNVAAGMIRHEPNHADHIHVRFACDPSDTACR